jgi:pimeloyl-ACP methyl ester carboxylesterase
MRTEAPETVLLLHGLWMNGFIMQYLAHTLRGEGFAAHTLTYRSIHDALDAHLARLARRIASLAAGRIHLVGHSTGGLVVLRYLQRDPDKRIGRTVLLGAPVGGCRAATAVARRPGGDLLLGKSLSIWREPVDVSLDRRFEVGVIAGTSRLGLGRLFVRLPEPNDGVVCVDETRLPGMRDHLALPVGHTAMLASPQVARQTAVFLKTGAFAR